MAWLSQMTTSKTDRQFFPRTSRADHWTVQCFAKVNLYLNISHLRKDGFHELQSIFQTVSLCDELYLQEAEEFSLSLDEGSSFPMDRGEKANSNLIEKVYRYFETNYRISPVSVSLTKVIPIGAGLGGGSSDAAGMIMALNEINKLGLDREALASIAMHFGSDVPFFLRGGTAKVSGRGEIVEPLKASDGGRWKYVLVYPDIHISTAAAYRENVEKSPPVHFEEFIKTLIQIRQGESFDSARSGLDKISKISYNSFWEKCKRKYPKLRMAWRRLKNFSPYVLMSGSGSSVFAVFNEEEDSLAALEGLEKDFTYVYHLHDNEIGVKLEKGGKSKCTSRIFASKEQSPLMSC